MKKIILLLFYSFLFHQANAQDEFDYPANTTNTFVKRNGIVSIARYADTTRPPTLDPSDRLPEFEGGIKALNEAFTKEFKFPASSLETEQGGEGIIGFTVDTLGNISDIEVIEAVSPEIDAEALYVFSVMPRFNPMWKAMKLAVSYNAFPSIYKDKIARDRTDSLVNSRKPTEWRAFVNSKRTFAIFSANMGMTLPTEQLNRYLRPMFQITGQLDIFKNRWGGSISGTLRPSTLRKDFEYGDNYWDKDSAITLNSIGLFAAYRLVDEDRLTFTPFIGFQAHFLALSLHDDLDAAPMIISFLPTIGGSIDVIRKQKVNNNWGTVQLNTSTIRLRFAINMANFKDGRRGNLIDFGVGLGWYTRQVSAK